MDLPFFHEKMNCQLKENAIMSIGGKMKKKYFLKCLLYLKEMNVKLFNRKMTQSEANMKI